MVRSTRLLVAVCWKSVYPWVDVRWVRLSLPRATTSQQRESSIQLDRKQRTAKEENY